MPLNIVKLCVGVASSDGLREAIAKSSASGPGRLAHVTRTAPSRASEIVGAGSVYWVTKGSITCRQRILGFDPFTDGAGTQRCMIVLDPEVVDVEPRRKKAFQGWRYLEPSDAPRDLASGDGTADMPDELRRELAGLGLL